MGDAMELDQAAAVPVRRSTVGKALLPPHEHPGLLVVECNVRWREDRCDDIPKHVGTMPHFPAMSWLMPSQSGPPPARAVLIHPFVRLDVSQLPGSPKKRKIEGAAENEPRKPGWQHPFRTAAREAGT